MHTNMIWGELTFQKWNQMLILFQRKGKPNFYTNAWFYYNVKFCVAYGTYDTYDTEKLRSR